MSPGTKKLSDYKNKHFAKYALIALIAPLACVQKADQGSRAKPQSLFAKMEASKKAESATKPESSKNLESSTKPEEGGKDEDIL